MNDALRHELFVKLNRISVLVTLNAIKIHKGKNLTNKDWKEAAALFNECISHFNP